MAVARISQLQKQILRWLAADHRADPWNDGQ
jgi:hypothetical protein